MLNRIYRYSISYQIGTRFQINHKFTEQNVQQFSDLSTDKNPIHLSLEAGEQSIFKQRIVHGLLTASLFSGLLGNNIPNSIYLEQYLKFTSPVYFNEDILASIEIINVEEKKDKTILSLKTQIIKIQENKLAIDGNAKILIH